MPRRTQKRRLHWAFYLWPGLPHLWNEGSWAGLGLAVGFTALLNATIVATLVWPEWLPERVKLACGLSTIAIWLAALVETRNELRRQAARQAAEQIAQAGEAGPSPPDVDEESADPAAERLVTEPADELPESLAVAASKVAATEALFRDAQTCYLAGDWVKTEQTLNQILRHDRNDIEAHLMLATLCRVVGEEAKATRKFERLARRADASEWEFEIRCELQRLQTATTTSDEAARDEATTDEAPTDDGGNNQAA